MNFRHVVVALLASASLALSQAPDARPDRDVRATIDRYLTALREGNGGALQAMTRPGAARFSPGGTRLGNQLGRSPRDKRKVSYFVRHVDFLRPDVALAVGVWRDPGALNPSGAFAFTLVREDNEWKFATVQETLNLPLPALDPSAPKSPMQQDGDWEILFDGHTAGHWLTIQGARDLGNSWHVQDGALIAIPNSPGADLRSDREYRSFEMTWEWMAAERSNSGVKYRLYGSDAVTFVAPRFATGWEYQMADDAGDSGARVDDKQKSGALYGVVPVSRPAAKPAREWNQSRLLVTEDHVEHWLNGVMTARYPIDVPFESPILLQHHASEVRFRNIRLRRIRSN